MIKENNKDERLKTAQTMVIKYMYNERLYVGVLFLSTKQYVPFDIFQLDLSRTCVVSLWFTYPLEFAVYIHIVVLGFRIFSQLYTMV